MEEEGIKRGKGGRGGEGKIDMSIKTKVALGINNPMWLKRNLSWRGLPEWRRRKKKKKRRGMRGEE